jgi:low affinity Fe/Cu permease
MTGHFFCSPFVTMAASRVESAIERLAQRVTQAVGSAHGFAIAVSTIIVWAAVGPTFGFSDTWQLVINTGTTIITFLVVFLIQRTQNKDALSVQLKLNEIVAALQGASNRLIDAEDLTETELKTLHRHYRTLATLAEADRQAGETHSVEEARSRHELEAGHREDRRKRQ